MAGRCANCSGTPTTPEEIIDIIGLRGLCPGQGLDYDEILRCIRVALAPGGGIAFDAFGRLQVTCCDGMEPQPGACVETIGQLGEFVVGGNMGGAGLLFPYGSPQAIQYGLDHALDMIVNDVWGTEDEIAVWSVYSPEVGLSSYTTSPTTAAGGGVTSSDWISLHVNAGSVESPTGRNAFAPAEFLQPDGGWYGWYAPWYQPQTFAQVLRGISQRVVTWGDISIMEGDPTFNSRSVVAAIRSVSTACTQESTILAVHPTMLASIASIANAGITPGCYVSGNLTPDPAEIAAAGAQWVRLAAGMSTATIEAYLATGMQVILRTTARHIETERALDLGVRGIHTFDPVYARGPVDLTAFGYYRRGQVSYVRRQTELGHLTDQTDDLTILSGRPFTKSTEFGLYVWAGGERPRNAILIGEVCPLPSPSVDSYTWECQVDEPGGPLPSGGTPKIGVNILQTTDVDSTPEAGSHDGYTVFIRVGTTDTGELVIGKFTPGGDYEEIAVSATTQAVEPNAWMSFRLEVTPTELTLTRTDVGTPYSVTVADSDYRGAYVAWLVNTTTEPASQFVAGVRQFVVASVAEAGTESAGMLALAESRVRSNPEDDHRAT